MYSFDSTSASVNKYSCWEMLAVETRNYSFILLSVIAFFSIVFCAWYVIDDVQCQLAFK